MTTAFEMYSFIRGWSGATYFDPASGWAVVNVDWGVPFSGLTFPS